MYAVFLRAREELERRGEHIKTPTPDEHSRVRARFKTGRFKDDGVSNHLGALYALRGQADYDLEASIGKNDVDQALEYVNQIMRTFDIVLFRVPPHG